MYTMHRAELNSRPRSGKDKKRRKSTSADPRQYANTAIKQILPPFVPLSLSLFLSFLPSPSLSCSFSLRLSISYDVDINRRTMSAQKCRQMGFPFPRYVARMLSPTPSPPPLHETTHNARFHRLSSFFVGFPIRASVIRASTGPRRV